MRVNARFDLDAETQVAYLSQVTGMGVSEVLRASVQHYYDAVRARQTGLKHLSAFIGLGDSGRGDVASTYKDRLVEGGGAKHGAPGPGAAPSAGLAVHESAPAPWPADVTAPEPVPAKAIRPTRRKEAR